MQVRAYAYDGYGNQVFSLHEDGVYRDTNNRSYTIDLSLERAKHFTLRGSRQALRSDGSTEVFRVLPAERSGFDFLIARSTPGFDGNTLSHASLSGSLQGVSQAVLEIESVTSF